MLNKPVDYVCSRNGQGSRTVYELLPEAYQKLNPVGRLDKDSSGLLLLTNDGALANQLTHPSYKKEKVYEVELDKILNETDRHKIEEGVQLEDGASQLQLKQLDKTGYRWQVTMHEGRNRQIRRTFKAMSITVTQLKRIKFERYTLDQLAPGNCKNVQSLR